MVKMTFIRIQNAKKDKDGNIVGGSASIVESVYQKEGSSACKQVLRESLGTIIFMGDRRSGVFMSKTRGLIGYDSETDEFSVVDADDPRIVGRDALYTPSARTFFGDTYLVLGFLYQKGVLRIIRNLATKNDALFEKIICHTLHGVLRDGSRIQCDRFIERSFISNGLGIKPLSLRTDTSYFETIGSFEFRTEFFGRFVKHMRQTVTGFGKGCYVDSTPLPNSITDLPTNALCSHGIASVGIQTRLILVLDIITGLPVWFDIIPGNVLDLKTVMNQTEKVSKLIDVKVEDMVLDAGYVCKEVIMAYNLDVNPDKTLIARLPGKKGFGRDDLFEKTHNLFSNAKYAFVRQGHSYFGIRKDFTLFGCREYAYVYLDTENASTTFKEYLMHHNEQYEKMTMKQKNWVRYKGGFFVIVSNIETTPDRMLDRYYGRTEIESAINCGKEYLDMLPLNKQKAETVNGKLMQDMMNIIAYMMIRKVTVPTGRSVSDYIYDLQSLCCCRVEKGELLIDPPNKQAKAVYELFGMKIPDRVNIPKFRSDMLFSLT